VRFNHAPCKELLSASWAWQTRSCTMHVCSRTPAETDEFFSSL